MTSLHVEAYVDCPTKISFGILFLFSKSLRFRSGFCFGKYQTSAPGSRSRAVVLRRFRTFYLFIDSNILPKIAKIAIFAIFAMQAREEAWQHCLGIWKGF